MTLSPVSGRQVSVEAETSTGSGDNAISSDDTGVEADDIDYTAKTETLIFAIGETTKTFSVDTKKDPDIESDETFTVTLFSASNATISTGSAKGTIQSDGNSRF